MAELKDKRFYVLRAISGKEHKVREQIEAEIRNTDLGQHVFSVFVPTEKIVSQRNGKKIVKERPSLPGYVLVEAVLVGDVAHTLRSMPNVIGFLGANRGGEPEPMNPNEVERLMRIADAIAESEGEYELELYVGDIVRVTQDAFAGCDAVVEEVLSDKRKVRVMVKMFGRKIPLELDYTQVAKE